MRAVRVHGCGGPDVLQTESLPRPTPGPDQVLVLLAACGVNFLDVLLRSGAIPRAGIYAGDFPYVVGSEAAGVIEMVGPEVRTLQVGDRVGICESGAAEIDGAYATHALASIDSVVKLPAEVSFQQAAAVLFQGLTAHALATSVYPLDERSTCLVHSAAGGVGSLLVQIAKLSGARVIAAASTPDKAALARDAGADIGLCYGDDVIEGVRHATGGQGVDVVYDAVGRDTFEMSLASLAPRGLLALYGQASGAPPPIDVARLLTGGSLFVTRVATGDYTRTCDEYRRRASDLFRWVSEGKVKARVYRSLPLKQADEAHRLLASRQTVGKLLLDPTTP